MQKLKLRLLNDEIVETTVGRVIFLKHCQKDSDFHWVNKVMKKSDLTKIS